MPAGVVVDDIHAIPRGVRNEHTPGFRIECAVIKRCVTPVRDFNDASRFQRHWVLPRSQCGRVERLDRPLRGLPPVVPTRHVAGIKARFAERRGRLASNVKSVDAEGDDRFLL